MNGLRRFVGAPSSGPATVEEQVEACEMCAAPMAAEHRHVVDIQQRNLLCTCRPCGLLFTRPDAGQGRYRAVPDRVLSDPSARISVSAWEALQIPVSMAFFLRSSATGEVAAFYPSPAGATECLLDLDAWNEMVFDAPMLGTAEPDVEAVIVRNNLRDRAAGGSLAFECFVVPVDACYELVGRIRLVWKGFDGGSEAHDDIEAFFARLRKRAISYAGTP